ncbi:MAG: ATP-binding protein [Litorilinea sp.]
MREILPAALGRTDISPHTSNSDVSHVSDVSHLQRALIELQADSVRAIAGCLGLVGYVWLMLIVSPDSGYSVAPAAWVGTFLLMGGSTFSLWASGQWIQWSKHVLIWSTLASVGCAALAWPGSATHYLFVLPVIFAGVLFNWRTVVLATLASNVVLFALVIFGPAAESTATLQPLHEQLVWPALVVGLAAFSSTLSTHNLFVALAWFAGAYEQAHRNERLAMEQQGELRRVLKALDESAYRVERANVMLTFARNQAEEARLLKQQFVQNISHELRTPLNMIVGFTELMVKSPEFYGDALPPMYQRDLGIVYRNATHLQTLVNDVLDLARIESAQMRFYPQEVAPGELVLDAVEMMRGLIESRGLAVEAHVPDALPTLAVDPIRIRQVLFNLLNNAARFTEQGTLRVELTAGKDELICSVQDSGPGIAPEDMVRIFDEFYQTDGSIRRRHGGVGLGLAICRQFVRMHGGRIWVESELGAGSTFYFSLPLESGVLREFHNPGQNAATFSFGTRVQSVVVVVTNNMAAAPLFHSQLGGARILLAASLEQGRALSQKTLPQAVVIDLACHDLTPKNLEALAQEWQLPQIPFVGLALPNLNMMHELAVDSYLVKPISRQDLLDTLRSLGTAIDRILIIDDDRNFVRLLQRMLQNSARRYQVSAAYSGEEGLALVEHVRPDLVLVDMVMPGMHGREFVNRLHALPGFEDLRIVVISAQDEIDYTRFHAGTVIATKGRGLAPGEAIRWVQALLHTQPSDPPPGTGHMPNAAATPASGPQPYPAHVATTLR